MGEEWEVLTENIQRKSPKQESNGGGVKNVEGITQHSNGKLAEEGTARQSRSGMREKLKRKKYELSVIAFKNGVVQQMIDLIVFNKSSDKIFHPDWSVFDKETIDTIIETSSMAGAIDEKARGESVEFKEYIHNLTVDAFLEYSSLVRPVRIKQMLHLLNADGFYGFIPKYVEVIKDLNKKLIEVIESEKLSSKEKNNKAIEIFDRAFRINSLCNNAKQLLIKKIKEGAIQQSDISLLEDMSLDDLRVKTELPKELQRFGTILEEQGYPIGGDYRSRLNFRRGEDIAVDKLQIKDQ